MSDEILDQMKQDQRLQSETIVVRLIRQDIITSFLLIGMADIHVNVNKSFYDFELPLIIMDILVGDEPKVKDELTEWYVRQVQYANRKWPSENKETLNSSAINIYYLLKEKLKGIID